MNRRTFLALQPLAEEVYGLAIDVWYDQEDQCALFVRRSDGLIVARMRHG